MIYGLVGMGAMGGGMAASLVRAGRAVSGYDPDERAQSQARSAGVDVRSSLAAVMEDAGTLIICLSTLSALDATYDQIISSAPARPTSIVETSTIAPERARALAERVRGTGRAYVEACMVGLPKDAAAGNLYHFVGSAPEDMDRVLPFLTATGRGYVHLGDVGSGAVAKVLNNAIGGATMLIFTEAILAAGRAGLDTGAFARAVIDANGAGNSVVFTRHAHWATGGPPQPPTPLNTKDMGETAALLRTLGGQYPLMSGAVAEFADLPDDVGLVQGYARRLRARD